MAATTANSVEFSIVDRAAGYSSPMMTTRPARVTAMAAAAVTPVAERGPPHQGGSEKTLPYDEDEDCERQDPEHCVLLPADVRAGGLCGWVLGHGKELSGASAPREWSDGAERLIG